MNIIDTTLRDGEQMPGVVFDKQQKIGLARMISDFGVDYIELMPAVSGNETDIAETLINEDIYSEFIASTPCNKKYIDLAKYCGFKTIVLFSSISDIHLDKKLMISREKNLSTCLNFVNYTKEQGLNVFFAGEDSTRADMNYLVRFINSLEGYIDCFLPCDTLGILTPKKTYEFISSLKEKTDNNLGLHIHNDFGCASACTLSGIEAGAEMISGTFNGIGERSGNASIEEVVISLKYQYDVDLELKYEMIGNICENVAKYSGVNVQDHKPISGKNAFAHESGLHVDGIIKHSSNYETYDPEAIGKKRTILYGKHSGLASLRNLFNGRFKEDRLVNILEEIKLRSETEKRAFYEHEIMEAYN